MTPPSTLYSLGGIVQWIDESLNTMLLNGLAQNVERLTAAIWAPLEIGVFISLLIYGFLIATQRIPTPFTEALVKIVKIVVIVAIVESGGFYQTQIMDAMLDLPDELTSVVVGEPTNTRDVLADFHNKGLETATKIDERAPSIMTQIGRSILFAIVSLIITIIYTAVTIVGILLMSVVKIGMALVVALGPMFIAALLFEQTKELFGQWLSQCLYFTLFGAVFTLMFSLVMGMLGYIQNILLGLADAPEINILQIMAAVMLIGTLSIFLMKLPSTIVGKVTGGASISVPFLGNI